VQQLIASLEHDFGLINVRPDVCHFLGDAHGRGWIA
jgi:hypothetical protein